MTLVLQGSNDVGEAFVDDGRHHHHPHHPAQIRPVLARIQCSGNYSDSSHFFFFHPTNSHPSVRSFSKHNQKQLNVKTEMTDLIDDWPPEIICASVAI